jgi:Uma2 family endonuclease
MSTMPIQVPAVSKAELRLRRVSVAEYHRMAEDGYFSGGERVELIDGLIIEKDVKKPAHSTVKKRCAKAIEAQIPPALSVRTEEPVTLSTSEPEPDVLLARGSDDDFAHRHPSASEVVLLVEVSDSSLDLDHGLKLRQYAAERISPYVILNIPDRQAEIRTQPAGDRYADERIVPATESIALETAAGVIRLDLPALFAGVE